MKKMMLFFFVLLSVTGMGCKWGRKQPANDAPQQLTSGQSNVVVEHDTNSLASAAPSDSDILKKYDEEIAAHHDTDIYYDRGSLKEKMGDYAGAAKDYRRLLKLKPGYKKKYPYRGIFKLVLKDGPAINSNYGVDDAEQQKMTKFLRDQMKICRHDRIKSHEGKTGVVEYNIPVKNGDTLLSYVIDSLNKAKIENAKYYTEAKKEGKVRLGSSIDYEVKMYAKGKIISVLVYFANNTGVHVSTANATYNFMKYDNHIYSIILPENNFNVDMLMLEAIHNQFDPECVDDAEDIDTKGLFFDFNLQIYDPYLTKVCNDPVVVDGALKYLQFTRVD